jgi:hypothetical protein
LGLEAQTSDSGELKKFPTKCEEVEFKETSENNPALRAAYIWDF